MDLRLLVQAVELHHLVRHPRVVEEGLDAAAEGAVGFGPHQHLILGDLLLDELGDAIGVGGGGEGAMRARARGSHRDASAVRVEDDAAGGSDVGGAARGRARAGQ